MMDIVGDPKQRTMAIMIMLTVLLVAILASPKFIDKFLAADLGEAAERDGISYILKGIEPKGDEVEHGGEEFIAVGKWMYADVEVKNVSDEDETMELSSRLVSDLGDFGVSSEVDLELTKELNDGLDITDLELGAGESVNITLAYDWGGKSLPKEVSMENEGDGVVSLMTE